MPKTIHQIESQKGTICKEHDTLSSNMSVNLLNTKVNFHINPIHQSDITIAGAKRIHVDHLHKIRRQLVKYNLKVNAENWSIIKYLGLNHQSLP